ncbi:hypothetical protein TorRG33x02_263130 [Trema orientale]|uniref:Uncharacterized protein n=1 Tax=Trema orientale TaxID=63057 RepID=A0A2P5D3X9_TREOI|nr:hypothetical protein TorRG33x02_263130 [Trema orientale]
MIRSDIARLDAKIKSLMQQRDVTSVPRGSDSHGDLRISNSDNDYSRMYYMIPPILDDENIETE